MRASISNSWRWSPRVAIVFATLAGVVALAGCGPSRPPGAQSGSAVAPEGDPAAALSQLQLMPAPKGLKWDMAEGVALTTASEPAKAENQYAIQITPTATTSMHRIGAEGNFGGGTKTYHITIWVKPIGATNAMVEARGKTLLEASRPADYGRAFFDLAAVGLAPNKLMTDDTKFKSASIKKDGDWKKISVDMTTRDGWVYFSVAMVVQGTHMFTGGPGTGLVVGGMTAEPAA